MTLNIEIEGRKNQGRRDHQKQQVDMPMLIYGKKHTAQQSFQHSMALIQGHSTHMVLKSTYNCIISIKLIKPKHENRNVVNQKL